ncbi:MAG TPA: ATP-binding protein [Thermoanaerobaculia bacterium]|nr:ATP-binding protein [Thermoanaerobaculia bacterium]
MPNHVLIVATEHAARASADVARSLHFTPVVAKSSDEALSLLEEHPFSLIAVDDESTLQRVRAAAEAKQPMTRVLRLPEGDGSDDNAVRRLMTRYLDPHLTSERPALSEERYRFLAGVLESFTGAWEMKDVVRRIVSVTREELAADRGWLLHPVNEQVEVAKAVVVIAGEEIEANEARENALIPMTGSQALVRRAMESPMPVTAYEGDADLDPELIERYGAHSVLMQVLRPREGEPWAFGLSDHAGRRWTTEEIAIFNEIGRYATLALNNAMLRAQSQRDMAKVNAILDQIPESAAIYNARGELERMNLAATREPAYLFTPDPEGRLRSSRHRYVDGSPLSTEELPSMRAIRGEVVKSDYLVRDPRTNDDRVINLKAAPIRDDKGRIIGSVVLSRDVTEERQNAERESWRRRRADCLANLGLESVTVQPTFDNLDEAAHRVADAIIGTAMIYLYSAVSGELHMVGMSSVAPTADAALRFREYLTTEPYHAGEGIPGTVFQIGRPLFFADVKANAIIDFARGPGDAAIMTALNELTLVAVPIESYGDRIGVLVMARSDERRNFDAEDLEFAQAIAERIGAAAHIHRLTRISQEGHRAAEELARREVDARVRFEAVLENAPVGIAAISADELRFELVNARFADFAEEFGKVPPDTKVVGLRVDEVFPDFERTLKQVAESGETRIDEAWEIASKPAPRYVNRIISAVRGRFSGITQSITILIQDVTEQVKAKREIEDLAQMMAERSARLDSILSSMTDGLWVYGAKGEVVDVNQAALAMFGLGSRTEAIENASFERFTLRYPDGRPIPDEDLPFARALGGGIVPDYLAIGRHLITGKDLDLSIAAAPIESGGVVGAVLVIRDITALQELDRKKDEFLSVASHELRTPLTTIKGYTQLLAQTVNELSADERSTYLTAVLGEIDRMMGLISELLDVSRIETNRLQIHPQQIRWTEFLERRASAFRVQNPGRSIRLDTSRATDRIVTADPDRMRQVIDNLLSNALKYSPETTDIDVTVTVEDGYLATSVADHGIGIPKDEIPQLFERFHRARNVSSRYYGGLGLGLYIAKAIIEAHRGSITVESEEGQGSRFTIELPISN